MCSVNDSDCIPGRLRCGMCETHYRRWRKHGSTASPRISNLSHYEIDATGCWLWQGATWGNGYGKTSTKIHGTRLAHRALYIEHIGPIPKGQDLDHLCRVHKCVNPKHLEPVSRSTNLVRGHEARQLCKNGLHDITLPGAVRPGTNRCVECWRISYRKGGAKWRTKKRLQATSSLRP
jgi:HNH endonuclease